MTWKCTVKANVLSVAYEILHKSGPVPLLPQPPAVPISHLPVASLTLAAPHRPLLSLARCPAVPSLQRTSPLACPVPVSFHAHCLSTPLARELLGTEKDLAHSSSPLPRRKLRARKVRNVICLVRTGEGQGLTCFFKIRSLVLIEHLLYSRPG